MLKLHNLLAVVCKGDKKVASTTNQAGRGLNPMKKVEGEYQLVNINYYTFVSLIDLLFSYNTKIQHILAIWIFSAYICDVNAEAFFIAGGGRVGNGHVNCPWQRFM